ncbi:MAG: hypothetical protein OES79_12075 [Planctomycetota bacterium]|nr:hypothetical protein [Planctomycetota bacterium]
MKQSFSCLPKLARASLLLVGCWPMPAVAQTSAVPAAIQHGSRGSTASGDVLLDSAINRLQGHGSVSARVRLQSQFFGHEVFGSGRYLQKGRGAERQIRLELSIPTTVTKNVMISVSNGRQWWHYVETADQQEMTVVDLTAVRAAAAHARADGLSDMGVDLARGGLPQTLQRLQDNFQFAPATQMTQAAGTIWITRGRWRKDRLQQLIAPTEKEQASKISRQLSGRLPREVLLYLHDGTLFPQKIEYLGSAPAEASAGQHRLLASIEFFEIGFDRLLDESHFQRPREMIAEDVTDRHLKEMGFAKAKRR